MTNPPHSSNLEISSIDKTLLYRDYFQRLNWRNKTMKALLLGLASTAIMTLGTACFADKPTLSGDYLEARTCSVYTGACHANGEAVTIGREATLVWHINKGVVDGLKVDGLNVVAVIAGKD